jgi:uroporphyrinogen decarboxylase
MSKLDTGRPTSYALMRRGLPLCCLYRRNSPIQEETMNAKELVYAQIRHQETRPIPYTLSFEGEVDRALDDHYGSRDWRGRLESAVLRIPQPVPWVDESCVPRYTDPYGTVWRTDRRPHYVETVPLEKTELDRYRFPDMDIFFTEQWREVADAFIRAHPDRFLVASFSLGLFERSWTLRGFEAALMDSVADPGFYDALIENIAVHQMQIIERLLDLPVDGIMFSDDWGYQEGVLLGPEKWRRYLKPRLKRMYRLTHQGGKLALSHCCGSIADVMEDVVEIGLDVLESVQPEAMDPYELKRCYGDRICFWGGLGSQSTIQFGSPRDIHREVERLCSRMGEGGGYILAPAKALQPGTPVENAAAVVEAFLRQAGGAV